MDACPGHILKSTRDSNETWYVDSWQWEKLRDGSERKCSLQEPSSYPVYLQSYLPLTIYFFIMVAYAGHILES